MLSSISSIFGIAIGTFCCLPNDTLRCRAGAASALPGPVPPPSPPPPPPEESTKDLCHACRLGMKLRRRSRASCSVSPTANLIRRNQPIARARKPRVVSALHALVSLAIVYAWYLCRRYAQRSERGVDLAGDGALEGVVGEVAAVEDRLEHPVDQRAVYRV